MILAERYKARRYAEGVATGVATGRAEGRAEGRATGRATGLSEAVEVAIRQTARRIDPDVEVTIDASQWLEREVMRVTLKKSGQETEEFEVTMGQALSPDLRPMLEWQLASLG